MNLYKISVIVVAAFFSSISGHVCASSVAGGGCVTHRQLGGGDDACGVSLYSVISYPEQFEGKNIRVTGYMRRVFDVIVLYPSRDTYIYSAGRDGVELLLASPDDVEIMRGKQDLEGATTVVGKFTTEIASRVRGSVGMVTGDIVVYLEPEPGLPPPLPQEKKKVE